MEIIVPVMGLFLGVLCNMFIQAFFSELGKNEKSDTKVSVVISPFLSITDDLKIVFSKVKNLNMYSVYSKVLGAFKSPLYSLNIVAVTLLITLLPLSEGWLFVVQALIIVCFDIMAVTDFNTFFISETMIAILVVAVIGNTAINPNITFVSVGISMIAYAILFGLFYLITRGKFAMGDVEMIVIMSGLLGWDTTIFALVFSMTLNVCTYLVMSIIFRKKIAEINIKNKAKTENLFSDDVIIEEKIGGLTVINGKVAMALGPFLAIGTIVFYFYSAEMIMLIMNMIN